VANVLDQAQNVGGVVSAARLRERWQRQEANATDPERREQLREAIADLEGRFPDLEDVPIGGAEAFAKERGHGTGARSPVHEGRRRTAAGRPARTGKSSPSKPASSPRQPKGTGTPGLDPSARRSPAQRRAARGAPTPRVDRAIRQTGIPSALSSSGSVAMATLGGTIGLSLAYLVFTSSETPGAGANAIPNVIKGINGVLHRFIGLGDVFPSNQRVNPRFSVQTQRRGPGGKPTGKPTTSRFRGQSTIQTAAERLKAAQEAQERTRAHKGG
jgi:hypothetical protein